MATTTNPQDPGGALLVIHGIGEQRPYEALGSFVQGLAGNREVKKGQLEHRLVWRDGHADTAVRVPLHGIVDRAGARWLDVYEYYWAADVERAISLRKVLAWTARTSLTPLRSWATNLDLLEQEKRPHGATFNRELGRAVGLIGLAATIIALFIYVGIHQAELRQLLAQSWQALVQPPPPAAIAEGRIEGLVLRLVHNAFPFVLFAWLVVVTMGVALLRSLSLLGSTPGEQATLKAEAFQKWRARTVFFAALFLGLAAVAALTPSLGIGAALCRSVAILLGTRYTLALVVAGALACAGRWFLVGYLGDLALYVDEDERSASFATREKVLKGAVDRLRSLLRDPRYVSVHVAGHSLGSVIAYDAVDHFAREMRAVPVTAGQPDTRLSYGEFEKLIGLLTFGSPLDKVCYFFRTDVKAREKVRSQLLSSLHSFRKQRTHREYGPMHFAVYDPPEPGRLLWLNVHSRCDRVSGSLDFYRPDHQVPMPYYPPTLWAHLRYWNDDRFYAWVALWLSASEAETLKKGLP